MEPRVVGVHPVDSDQPVHLIEIDLTGCESRFSWEAATQSVPNLDEARWQAAYDEQPVPDRPGHWCFFFHLLNLEAPLSSSLGELLLPPASPTPVHLRTVRYEIP